MGYVFLMAICIIIAIVVPFFMKDKMKRVANPEYNEYDLENMKKHGVPKMIVEKEAKFTYVRLGIRTVFVLLAAIFFFLTSAVWVGENQVGLLNKVYLGKQLPKGRIIAMPDELGPQARILGPGFHFEPFIEIIYKVTKDNVITIQDGSYGFVTTKDGNPLLENTYIADPWENKDEMIDAFKFMGWTGNRKDYKGPAGTKGPQITVLTPGPYRLNTFLFKVVSKPATDVKIGYVAVIKSNHGKVYTGPPILPDGVESTTLSVPIVPKGYIGVWNKVLKPSRYYLNVDAYEATFVPTTVQTWKYIGGYKKRFIDLELDSNGEITQKTRNEEFIKPDDAVDIAVLLRVENWDIYQDARLQVQVTPENAPFVVAVAGNLKNIEDKIMTPTFRSVLRNEVAKEVKDVRKEWDEATQKMVETEYMRPRKVMDLFYKREETETSVETKLIPEGRKYGLTVMEVRFGDPSPPPELLIPGKRQQLAESLVKTYRQEQIAQTERVKKESEKARADQQGSLMKSQIGIEVADNNAKARQKAGSGEEQYMVAIARGQKAQANVLGSEFAFQLELSKIILDAAASNPDIVKFPLVLGNDTGITGAAALLGRSNLNIGLNPPKAKVEGWTGKK